MSNTIVKKDLLAKEIIRYLDKKSVISSFANTEYESKSDILKQGDTVSVQSFPSVEFLRGRTAGADITESNFAITSEDLVIDQVAQVNIPVLEIEKIQSNLPLESKIADRIAYAKKQLFDRFVAGFVLDANANNRIAEGAPATLSKTTVVAGVEAMREKLDNNDVDSENSGLFVNPAVASLVRQSDLYTGFDKGLGYRTGMFSPDIADFKGFKTNNCPRKQKLSMATNPTADDTVAITVGSDTVTLTFKAAPSAAGEVDIGANVAGSQANLLAAINGTGTPGASTYIALSTANRDILRNAGVELRAWATNVAYLTSEVAITAAETFTDGTDAFGTAGLVIFGMDHYAINFVCQMSKMDIRKPSNAFKENIILELVYGGKVFDTNAKRITTSEITNGASV